MDSDMFSNESRSQLIWIGVAIGAAIGLGIAFSRGGRKRTAWDSAREVAGRVADRSGDITDSTRDIVERIKTIYDESRKVVEQAGEIWNHGRKLVGV